MMNPRIFPILRANNPLKAVLGDNPFRVYPWGESTQDVVKPYVTYSVFSGVPENYVTNVPDIDNMGTQIDVWSENSTQCESIATMIRNILQTYGHMTSFEASDRDPETKLWRCRMDFDFWESR